MVSSPSIPASSFLPPFPQLHPHLNPLPLYLLLEKKKLPGGNNKI